MPRYFFDFHKDGMVERDDEGVELGGPVAARAEAVRAIKDAVTDEIIAARLVDVALAWVEIRDGEGNVVTVVNYAEALGLQRPHAAPDRQ